MAPTLTVDKMCHMGYYQPMDTPKPPRPRSDGWTVERQRAFLAVLAETGSPTAAAEAVGKSVQSVHRLRKHPGASGFRAAWDLALHAAAQMLGAVALERALYGTATPIVHKGEVVGERRVYSNQLLLRLLDQAASRAHDDGVGVEPRLFPRYPSRPRTLRDLSLCKLDQPELQDIELDIPPAPDTQNARSSVNLE